MIVVAKLKRREVEDLAEAEARERLKLVDGVRYKLKVARWDQENGLELEIEDLGPQPEPADKDGSSAWD